MPLETVSQPSFNPLDPPFLLRRPSEADWGGIRELGDTPKPSAGRILHPLGISDLEIGGALILTWNLTTCLRAFEADRHHRMPPPFVNLADNRQRMAIAGISPAGTAHRPGVSGRSAAAGATAPRMVSQFSRTSAVPSTLISLHTSPLSGFPSS